MRAAAPISGRSSLAGLEKLSQAAFQRHHIDETNDFCFGVSENGMLAFGFDAARTDCNSFCSCHGMDFAPARTY